MKSYDVVIVGAGSAGMSYAAILAQNKKRVLIVDKKNYMGGRAATRKAKEWKWHRSNELINYGPHIVPTRGYLEFLLNILGVKKQLRLKKLNLPYIYKNGKIIEIPEKIFNINHLMDLYRDFYYLHLKEKAKFLILLKIAHFNSIPKLIKKYDKISMYELAKKLGLQRFDILELIALITGTSVLSINLKTCPALDFLIMLKLILNGLLKEKTIMYEVVGGYGKIYGIFKKIIEKNNGKIILGKEVKKLIIEDEKIVGIMLRNKKIYARQIVFSGVPKEFDRLLKYNKLNTKFLKEYYDLKPAKIVDLILLSNKKIHNANTTWLYILLKSNYSKRKFGRVIIEESINLKNKYLYHICYVSLRTKKDKKIKNLIKRDLKDIFKFDFSENVLWSRIEELDVYGSEKTIKLPFSKRVGPETPFKNLFVIGDSYKALTTGTDGCAFSALLLAEKTLKKNFNLDKVL